MSWIISGSRKSFIQYSQKRKAQNGRQIPEPDPEVSFPTGAGRGDFPYGSGNYPGGTSLHSWISRRMDRYPKYPGVTGPTFGILFLIYMIIYLLDELLVFGTVSITLQSSKLQEEHGRVLKLVGGSLMLTLAVSFLFAPELMTSLTGSLIVFGGAIIGSLTLVLIRKVILPSLFGIEI